MIVTALSPAHEQLLDEFAEGRRAALARAVSIVENHRPGFDGLLATCSPSSVARAASASPVRRARARARSPRVLVKAYRDAGLTVGIVAVDPTSPFTGGALLGDRIRMESVALDAGVFIRSMATRGSLGGLAATTSEVATCSTRSASTASSSRPSAWGRASWTSRASRTSSVVVLVPESGDSIQTLKAGLMEIADVFVVNKADRPGADRLRNELELMLGLRCRRDDEGHAGAPRRRSLEQEPGAVGARGGPAAGRRRRGRPPCLRTVAVNARGHDRASLAALDRLFRYLERSGELRLRRRRRLRDRVMDVVESAGARPAVEGRRHQRRGSTAAARARGGRAPTRTPSPTRCSREVEPF